MDKSMFERYIQEMRALKASAIPVMTEAVRPAVHSEPNSDDMQGMGKLIVIVTSVRGIYPVENARVTVFTGDGKNAKTIGEYTTDNSGRTPVIELPAPSSAYTESPDPTERPFAYYNIKTVADGFVDALNYNVAVFDKTTSLQNVNLQPLTTGVGGNQPIVINEYENYNL